MACDKRLQTGHCNHSQCQYPDESGYNCVEIVGGYCEIGEGCVKCCPYSWSKSDKKSSQNAEDAFRVKYDTLLRKNG